MTLYRQGLRQQLVPSLIWAAVFAALVAAVVPSARAMVPGLAGSFLAGLPSYLRVLMGGELIVRRPLDGYLYAKAFSFFPLLIAIFAAFQAAALIAREVDAHRFDFLLGLPVSRRRLVLARLGALLTVVAGLWGVILLALYAMLRQQGYTGDWPGYWLFAYTGFLADAALAAAALWVSSGARTYRSALRVALGVAYVPFLYDFALRLAQVPAGWLLALPYGYLGPVSLLLRHRFPWLATVVLILATAGFGALSVSAFEHREV